MPYLRSQGIILLPKRLHFEFIILPDNTQFETLLLNLLTQKRKRVFSRRSRLINSCRRRLIPGAIEVDFPCVLLALSVFQVRQTSAEPIPEKQITGQRAECN